MGAQYLAVRLILWGAFAGSVTIAILGDFAWPTVLLLAAVAMALGYWLTKYRYELGKRYEMAQVAIPLRGWLNQPVLPPRARGPSFLAIGLTALYFAYIAAHGDTGVLLARHVYQIFGVPGLVGFYALLASAALAYGIELTIGAHVTR